MSPRDEGGGLPVLTYHAFGTPRSITATEPSWFVETLDRLAAAGFHAVDLDEWEARGRPDVPRGFGLAFDDGLASILAVAGEVAARRIPATVFVVSGRAGLDNDWPGQPAFVRRERLLGWDELRALRDLGFRFGAHGETHAALDRLPPARLADELRRCRETIEGRLGDSCRLLAYPYGASGPAVRLAASREYAAAFGTRLGYADSRQDPFDLARIDAYYLRDRRALDALVGDGWRPWLSRRERLRGWRRRASALLPPRSRPAPGTAP